jgi:hypothetical protein
MIGVQAAAVNVICELARRNPKNYLALAPIFFRLMTSSTNNWVLIKIIKLVGNCHCSCLTIVHVVFVILVRCIDTIGATFRQEINRAIDEFNS